MPIESGTLASVPAALLEVVIPNAREMAVQIWTSGWFVGITPAGRSPASSSLAWPSPSFACRSTIASTFRSRSAKHRISTERMSSSISASDAMVLTVVPPRITPTLYVVFGSLDHRCL